MSHHASQQEPAQAGATPRLGVSGRIAAYFQTAQITPLLALVAFLLGHLAFGVAFAVHGVTAGWVTGLALALTLPAMLVRRWLAPYLPSAMRRPVDAYIVVISAMVAMAIAATIAGGTARIAIGAIMFYLSDLSVARDRYVRREASNRLWGLPLYYGAQLVLASTIAAA